MYQFSVCLIICWMCSRN